MTTKILEPAPLLPAELAPALPQVPATTLARVDRVARNVVFWGLMGIGSVLPVAGGLYGLVRSL